MSTKYQELMSQYQQARAEITARYSQIMAIEEVASQQRKGAIEKMRDDEYQALDTEYGLSTQVIVEAPSTLSAIAPPTE